MLYILWNAKIRYGFHNSPQQFLFRGTWIQSNLSHHLPCTSVLIIDSHLRFDLPRDLFPWGSSTKVLHELSFQSCPLPRLVLHVYKKSANCTLHNVLNIRTLYGRVLNYSSVILFHDTQCSCMYACNNTTASPRPNFRKLTIVQHH